MNCEGARDRIILAAYGELPDEDAINLEQHLLTCEECLDELNQVRRMNDTMALYPMVEPDPNLLTQSRMRLDDALDAIPADGFFHRFRANANAWLGHLQGAPALATLLVGVGFLGGNFVNQYQARHAVKPGDHTLFVSGPGGGISSISGIIKLPDSRVQISYNRVVPEMAQGSLDDPQILSLLMVGTKAATNGGVRADSVEYLSTACQANHSCGAGSDLEATLVTSLRTDKNPGVRLRALEGLKSYVSRDERVRDAVALALLSDASAEVRQRAITMLQPVQSDTSVRQVLQTVSTTDANPYIRTVSTQVLAGDSPLQ